MADETDTPAFPLLDYLDRLIDDLRARIPAALNEWEPEAIHQSRVATRRMKSALDLMKIVLSKRPCRAFGKLGRKLRRRLGPLRDVDVMLDHLQSFSDEGKFPLAAQWLSERLKDQREHLRRNSARKKAAENVVAKLALWDAVREEIVAARDAVDSLLAEALHLQLDVFAEQADRLATGDAETTDAADTTEASGTSDESVDSNFLGEDARQDPHELRISGKALRYTLEMAVVEGHDLPASLTKTFKKMQESLGLWHDYVVLVDYAMQAALDEQLAHHQPRLMTDVFELSREVLSRATRHLGKFKKLWAEEGDAVAKAIRGTFPLTRRYEPSPSTAEMTSAVSESQTDPDPFGSERPEDPEDAPPTSA